MSVQQLESLASPEAIAAVAQAQLYLEPEWIKRAADQEGYEWARIAWQRAAAQPGAWFDAEKADKVVKLWPTVFKLTSGRFANKPFILRFWQEIIVRLLVGWKVPIDVIDELTDEATTIWVRLFRELRLWIARKNGKSEFLSALALLFWALEGEVRGQGFVFAHDENQAKIVFDKMADMVGYAPPLSKDIKVFAKSLWIQSLKSAFKLLSGKAIGKHGRAPNVTVGDEMHEWKSRELADTLRQGEGGSTQPIRLYASTASLKSQIVGHELYEESEKVLDGRIDDPTTLVVIFKVPEDADWREETKWPLANPSIGLSPTLAFLRGEAAKGEGNPRAEATFRAFHLNQFVDQISKWLPIRKWDACVADKDLWKEILTSPAFARRECYLAFDSTWTFDFGALCYRFEPLEPKGKPVFAWRCWLPQETLEQRVKNEQVPYDRWRNEGAIEEVPGATFQNSYAIKAVREACARFKVKKIGWDSWGAKEFYVSLVSPPAGDDAKALPEDLFEEMRFGTKTLGEASKSFERRVFEKDLDHTGHPVARMMAGYCHVRFDENMNFVPAKKKSEKSIDLIMTAVMAEALALAQSDRPSFWQKQH